MPITNSTVGPSVGPAVVSVSGGISDELRWSASVIGPSGGPLMPLIVTNETAMSPCKYCHFIVVVHSASLSSALAAVVVRGPSARLLC